MGKEIERKFLLAGDGWRGPKRIRVRDSAGKSTSFSAAAFAEEQAGPTPGQGRGRRGRKNDWVKSCNHAFSAILNKKHKMHDCKT